MRTHAKVLRIESGKDGLATGVTYVDAHGNEHFQPAETVIVSAFTLENNRMLLLSRSKQHPGGIGNDRGRVGKNYTYQIYPAPVTGLWEGEKLNMYMGNTCTIKIIYDYNADNFDHSDLDFIGGSQLYSEPCEREPVNSVNGLKDKKGRAWGADWKNEIRKNWDSYAQIVTEGESLPYVDQFVDLDPNYTDKWGNPLLRISFDWHDNQRALWRFVAKKALAIMKEMNPTKIVDFKPGDPGLQHREVPVHPPDRRLRDGQQPRAFGDQHLRPGLGHAERLRHRGGALPSEPRRQPDRNGRCGDLPTRRGDARQLSQESR